jgi:hypothetical protein
MSTAPGGPPPGVFYGVSHEIPEVSQSVQTAAEKSRIVHFWSWSQGTGGEGGAELESD